MEREPAPDLVVPFAAKNFPGGLMAQDELDELLAVLARERAVIDHYKFEAHDGAGADGFAEDRSATDQRHTDEQSV